MNSEQPPIPTVPDKLGRYRIVRLIQKGGMSQVFEARRESIAGVSPRVALKLIDPERAHEKAFRQLFINEAQVSSNLRHQNLVQIQDFDEAEGFFFLVMEYVEGITLRQLIKLCRRHGIPIPVHLIAEVGRQICDGLNHAHKACTPDGRPLGLVHRDIKPSNLMINPQGVVKVLDFGVSHATTAKERPGAVRGTWGYMAPEQAAGEPVTPRTDLFGVAVALYEMAALQPMFEDKKDTAKLKERLLTDEAARIANKISNEYKELTGILVRALQRDPEARYGSADALGRDLAALVPDLVRARQELVTFWDQLAELMQKGSRALSVGGVVDDETNYTNAPGKAPPKGEKPANNYGFAFVLLMPFALALILFSVHKVVTGAACSDPNPAEEVGVVNAPIEPTTQKQPVEASEKTRPAEPVEQTTQPPKPKPKKTSRKKKAEKEKAPPKPEPAVLKKKVSEVSMLTIAADTKAKVFIDGVNIRHTPLFQHVVSPGVHRIHLVHGDGRGKVFNVDAKPGKHHTMVWSFFDNKMSRKSVNPIDVRK